METTAPRPQTFSGTVVKTAMKDTTTVAITRYVKHPKYKKYQTRTKKFLVHDPENTAQVGDLVTIEACRPISKLKRFALKSIDQRPEKVDVEAA
jgi:small subunit ribosomal protein S17